MEDGEKERNGRGGKGGGGEEGGTEGWEELRIEERKRRIERSRKNMFSKMAFTNEYTLEKKYHKNVSLHFLKQKYFI